jgi:hypothetical protein
LLIEKFILLTGNSGFSVRKSPLPDWKLEFLGSPFKTARNYQKCAQPARRESYVEGGDCHFEAIYSLYLKSDSYLHKSAMNLQAKKLYPAQDFYVM